MTAYLIELWGCVDPTILGPFENHEKRNTHAAEWFGKNGQWPKHALFALDVDESGKPDVCPYSGRFAEEACETFDDRDEVPDGIAGGARQDI